MDAIKVESNFQPEPPPVRYVFFGSGYYVRGRFDVAVSKVWIEGEEGDTMILQRRGHIQYLVRVFEVIGFDRLPVLLEVVGCFRSARRAGKMALRAAKGKRGAAARIKESATNGDGPIKPPSVASRNLPTLPRARQ